MNKLNTTSYLVMGGIVIFISVFAYIYNFNDHILSNKPSDWSSFGSYLGGTIAPILTFFTLIILIKQAQVVHQSTITQVNHLNKSNEIENIMKIIESTSLNIKKLEDKIIPTPLLNIQLIIGNSNHDGWAHDFENENFLVKYSDSVHMVYKWKTILTYLNDYIKKGIELEKVLSDSQNNELKITIENININIVKLIYSCQVLFSTDQNSLYYIFFILKEHDLTVRILNEIGSMDQNIYKEFIVLKSLYSESTNMDRSLKELFLKELIDFNLISKEVNILDDSEISYEIDNAKICFLLKYKNKEFIRSDNKWSSK